MIDLDALEALARKATPDWTHAEEEERTHAEMWNVMELSGAAVASYCTKADARFTAALNPQTVLALIEMARKGSK